jgi:hypothetical protein
MYNVVWIAGVRRLGPFASALLLGAMLSATSAADAAKEDAKKPTLEEELRQQAPKIRDFLWKKMDHPQDALHGGVLKFHVQLGEGPPSDNVGSLNLYMARRLEAALILCLHNEDKIRILHNASAQIQNGSANHQTPRGRKAFFAEGARLYRPAWGGEEGIPAHVFLTGLVKIHDEGRTAEVVVRAFDRRGQEPQEVCTFRTAADPRLLTEAGISCVVSRGSDPNDWAVVALANPDSVRADEKKTRVEELLKEAPIEVQILYNGEVQKVTDGTVSEPTPKDVVTFRLKHKNKDKNTYGVILKINGQNTLLPDNPDSDDFFRCFKWIVKPHTEFEIKGYQKDLKEKAKAFKVLSAAQSRRSAVYYGEHAGTFTVIVLEGQGDDEKPQIVEALPDEMVAIGRGVPNRLGDFGSLEALQGHLKKAAKGGRTGPEVPKGMIQQGADTEQMVEEVPFRASAKRIPVIQIRYYKPSGEK